MPYALYINNEKAFVHPSREACLYYAGHCIVTGRSMALRLYKDAKPFYTTEGTIAEAKRIHPYFRNGG